MGKEGQSFVLLGPWELYEKKQMKDFQVIQNQPILNFMNIFFLKSTQKEVNYLLIVPHIYFFLSFLPYFYFNLFGSLLSKPTQ